MTSVSKMHSCLTPNTCCCIGLFCEDKKYLQSDLYLKLPPSMVSLHSVVSESLASLDLKVSLQCSSDV